MTQYIQAALIDPEMKRVLEALRTDCLVNGTNASAVQTDLDTTEGTVIADLTAIRTATIAALTAADANATALNVMATKLNADAGVTDTNYATNNATTHVSGSSPAAITTA